MSEANLRSVAPPARVDTANGVTLLTTTTAESSVFDRFYAGYDKAFVLPNEKEDAEGFARCFELNVGADYARLSALYGAYSEVSVVAEFAGAEIGGANFIAMPTDARTVTANLNYIYVSAGARGGGNFSRLLESVRELISGLFGPRERVLIFIEQNDPIRMSAEDYENDTRFTGLDQFDRLRIWANRGARVVDFPYKQPPLSTDQAVDDTLLYSVLGAGDDLDACTLERHLRRFFGVSVLKGADLASNPAANEQVETLARACSVGASIATLDPQRVLSLVKRRGDVAHALGEWPRDFRAALKL